jgi:hypothetical protein
MSSTRHHRAPSSLPLKLALPGAVVAGALFLATAPPPADAASGSCIDEGRFVCEHVEDCERFLWIFRRNCEDEWAYYALDATRDSRESGAHDPLFARLETAPGNIFHRVDAAVAGGENQLRSPHRG